MDLRHLKTLVQSERGRQRFNKLCRQLQLQNKPLGVKEYHQVLVGGDCVYNTQTSRCRRKRTGDGQRINFRRCTKSRTNRCVLRDDSVDSRGLKLCVLNPPSARCRQKKPRDGLNNNNGDCIRHPTTVGSRKSCRRTHEHNNSNGGSIDTQRCGVNRQTGRCRVFRRGDLPSGSRCTPTPQVVNGRRRCLTLTTQQQQTMRLNRTDLRQARDMSLESILNMNRTVTVYDPIRFVTDACYFLNLLIETGITNSTQLPEIVPVNGQNNLYCFADNVISIDPNAMTSGSFGTLHRSRLFLDEEKFRRQDSTDIVVKQSKVPDKNSASYVNYTQSAFDAEMADMKEAFFKEYLLQCELYCEQRTTDFKTFARQNKNNVARIPKPMFGAIHSTTDDLYIGMEMLHEDLFTSILDDANVVAPALLSILNLLIYLRKYKYHHRDFHPQNIMIKNRTGGRKQFFLIDFGYSKAVIADQRSYNVDPVGMYEDWMDDYENYEHDLRIFTMYLATVNYDSVAMGAGNIIFRLVRLIGECYINYLFDHGGSEVFTNDDIYRRNHSGVVRRDSNGHILYKTDCHYLAYDSYLTDVPTVDRICDPTSLVRTVRSYVQHGDDTLARTTINDLQRWFRNQGYQQ